LKVPESDPTLSAPDPLILTTDPLLRRKLDAAQDYIKVRSWPEAVRLLQGVLDAREDGFLKIAPTGARGKGAAKWVSARAEAERAAGSRALEEPTWAARTRQLRGEPLRLGTQTVPAEDLRLMAQRMAPAPGPADDWPLYRGDVRRAARAAAAPFLLEPARSIS